MASAVLDVTDANFDAEVLKSPVPVLVDFWATWCAPCKALAPHVATLATEHGGKLKCVKVDVQVNQKTAAAFKVSNLPTFLVFKNGAVVGKVTANPGGLAGLRALVKPHV